MDTNDLSGAYLPPEVGEEAVLEEVSWFDVFFSFTSSKIICLSSLPLLILFQEGIDVETVDPNAVVFVDDIGDIIVPEVYQEWPEEAVTLEEVTEEEQVRSISFFRQKIIIYQFVFRLNLKVL